MEHDGGCRGPRFANNKKQVKFRKKLLSKAVKQALTLDKNLE